MKRSSTSILAMGLILIPFLWGGFHSLGIHMWPTIPNWLEFINLPSFAIVLGGVYLHALISFPTSSVMDTTRAMSHFFSHPSAVSSQIDADLKRLLDWQKQVFMNGTKVYHDLSESLKDSFEGYVFGLLASNYSVEQTRMMADIASAEEYRRKMETARVFQVMGNVSPAFGMLGTLLGLILMLSNFEEAQQLAGGLAIALMTTLFGLLFAQLVFSPMAQKLRHAAITSRNRDQAVLDTLMLIASGAGSLEVVDRFNAYANAQ
jgi:chemotaxis protein MotA